ncbi:hypothetical protein DMC30DRAFT_395940 [Rhodotorula diobovata]|uniref:Uncharacterized protein n=1 Tax=Rhodotorula diobovata TaxID=5288 RepID=A0A5C5FWD9_9BASI|nr:hypothetical protein DMC30DRAFT_395940 [Rhodotorula diobovata]
MKGESTRGKKGGGANVVGDPLVVGDSIICIYLVSSLIDPPPTDITPPPAARHALTEQCAPVRRARRPSRRRKQRPLAPLLVSSTLVRNVDSPRTRRLEPACDPSGSRAPAAAPPYPVQPARHPGAHPPHLAPDLGRRRGCAPVRARACVPRAARDDRRPSAQLGGRQADAAALPDGVERCARSPHEHDRPQRDHLVLRLRLSAR